MTISSTIVAGNNAPARRRGRLGDIRRRPGAVHGQLSPDRGQLRGDVDDHRRGSNITGTDPDLGPLQDNGGPTETLLPNLTSPVIDAGVANGLTTDQRGLPRTFDPVSVPNKNGSDGTDIGSTELQAGENGLPGNADCLGAVVPSKTGTEAGETITGTEGPDALFGAGGDDTLQGLGANDCLSGDAGNDTADGGAGGDLISGGDGNDNLKGVGGKDKLNGEGGKDKANGGAGKDKLTGGGGKDKLKGSGGKDKVSGGGGKDKINPGKGKDKVKAGGGKDKINTADGKKDKLNCGGGKDKATVDAKDKVKANCDVVKVTGSAADAASGQLDADAKPARGGERALLDHPVDEPVLDRLLGAEEAVALHVLVQLLDGLPGVAGVDLLGAPAQLEHLAGVDLDVGGLPLEARGTAGGSGSASSAAPSACRQRRRRGSASRPTSRSRSRSSARRGRCNASRRRSRAPRSASRPAS